MRRSHLMELHDITPIDNVRSICEHGILSNNKIRSLGLAHNCVAMREIQDIRKGVKVPGTGKPLHDYANLYICARNPMLFKRQTQHEELCVLRVSCDVLDLRGCIVTDGNAASGHSRFEPAPAGLEFVDKDRTFARDWRDDFQPAYWKKKSQKCAEVLVPTRVDPEHLEGAYVSCTAGKKRFTALGTGLTATIDADFFFLT
jgi:hypothetical protein